MKPLVSIIIPTRDRQTYLLDAVETIRTHAPGVEIVISDNSSDDRLATALADWIAQGTVKYAYSGEVLSVVQNFERGLSMATGEYLMAIGDDDCIGPGLLEIAAWAKRNGVDAVVSYTDAFIASYFWPGVESRFFGTGYAGKLFLHKCSGRAERLDPKREIEAVAKKFGGGLGKMPRIYHGLVAKALCDRIKVKYGCVFGGVSPDIFSATLISAEAEHSFWVDFPFVIPGASPRSTAGQGAARTDRGGLRSTEHISRFGAGLAWDPRIPEFYSPFTVWAYSMLKALELAPQLRVVPAFPRLYARCFLKCRDHVSVVLKSFKIWAGKDLIWSGGLGLSIGMVQEVGAVAWWALKRLSHPKPGGSATSATGLEKISLAYQELDRLSLQKKIQLNLTETGRIPKSN